MNFKEIFIKPASLDDFEFYYLLKCEPESVYWSGFKNVPNKSGLYTWFSQKVEIFKQKDSYKLYIIFAVINDKILKVGYLSFYPSDDYNNCCEIGIGISTAYMGRKAGTEAIKMAINECKKFGYQKVVAYIRQDNVRSSSAFVNAGFFPTFQKKKVYIDNLNNVVEMLEYKYPGGKINA